MNVVGHIGGAAAGAQVCVVAKYYPHALFRHRFSCKALFLDSCNGNFIQAKFAQCTAVTLATQGVAVFNFDQLGNGVHAVPNHRRRFAACGRHQFVAHHQEAIIVAGNELLDDGHATAVFFCSVKGNPQVLFVHNIDSYAFALISVAGFDHNTFVGGLC